MPGYINIVILLATYVIIEILSHFVFNLRSYLRKLIKSKVIYLLFSLIFAFIVSFLFDLLQSYDYFYVIKFIPIGLAIYLIDLREFFKEDYMRAGKK